MSPLARSLLALACAALLHAACAQYNPPYCNYKREGINGSRIEFPLIYLKASLGRKICFTTKDVYDNKDAACENTFYDSNYPDIHYELVGVSARACDYYVTPALDISHDLTTICVTRKGPYLEPDATLLIWEFCLPK